MKIYELSKIPGIGNQPPKEPDYEAIFQSGYTAGYEDGYASVPCYENQYLTIEMTTSGSVAAWGTYRNVQYRLNGGEWTTITAQTVDAEAGDKIEFRGRNSTVDYLFYGDNGHGGQNGITGSCIIYGNIMSLLYGEYFQGKVAFPDLSTRTFLYTFRDCRGITDATNLVLPALTLNGESCRGMFWGCENMVHGPAELPATVLDQACYDSMFKGCASLTVAPELPATVMRINCYRSMFQGCTSLTAAPELPSTTLDTSCYQMMFSECSSLVKAPALPATVLAYACYGSMFVFCTSLVNAPELPATTLADYCYSQMFTYCTSLAQAPVLPATTLAEYCYKEMFQGCSGLTAAPELPATTLVRGCYQYMFVAASSIVRVKCLAEDITALNCTERWFYMVHTSGTFIKDPNTTWPTGASGIPQGWTVVDAS